MDVSTDTYADANADTNGDGGDDKISGARMLITLVGQIFIYALTQLVLVSLGVTNRIALLAFVALFTHLFHSMLQIRMSRDSSLFMAMITLIAYVLLPIVRPLFIIVKMLPYANVWLDHAIVVLVQMIGFKLIH